MRLRLRRIEDLQDGLTIHTSYTTEAFEKSVTKLQQLHDTSEVLVPCRILMLTLLRPPEHSSSISDKSFAHSFTRFDSITTHKSSKVLSVQCLR